MLVVDGLAEDGVELFEDTGVVVALFASVEPPCVVTVIVVVEVAVSIPVDVIVSVSVDTTEVVNSVATVVVRVIGDAAVTLYKLVSESVLESGLHVGHTWQWCDMRLRLSSVSRQSL